MAQSRAYFKTEIEKLGFTPYHPKADVFKYLEREWYRVGERGIALSPEGCSVEVTLVNTEFGTVRKFSSYSEAWRYLNENT